MAGTYEDFFIDVVNDRAAAVQAALLKGFDPNAADPRGQRALHLAMREDANEVAGLLLAHPDIEIDALNAIGETPLMIAALTGRTVWVQQLLERGAQADREGWTPLHYAAAGPEPKTVALLLARRVRVDPPSPNGTTPLMMASRYGSEDSVVLLLKAGASVKLRNQPGLNAADFARAESRDRLADALDRLARR